MIKVINTHPNSSLCQVTPRTDLLPRREVGVAVTGKVRFEFLQLLAREMCALSTSSLLLPVVLVVVRIVAIVVTTLHTCFIKRNDVKFVLELLTHTPKRSG